jgi:hypothetical protein
MSRRSLSRNRNVGREHEPSPERHRDDELADSDQSLRPTLDDLLDSDDSTVASRRMQEENRNLRREVRELAYKLAESERRNRALLQLLTGFEKLIKKVKGSVDDGDSSPHE